MKKKLLPALLILLFPAAGTAAAAQETPPPSASPETYAVASLDRTNLFLGEVASLELLIRSPEAPEIPAVIDTNGLHLVFLPPPETAGRPDTRLFRFSLRPLRAGDLLLPALTFSAGRESVSTRPLRLHVRKPQPTDRMRLTLSLARTDLWEGEAVPLTVTWESEIPFSAVKAVDFHLPLFRDDRFRLLDLESEPPPPGKPTGLPVEGRRIIAARRTLSRDGRTIQRLTFRRLLVPLRAGDFAPPPATLLCAVKQNTDRGWSAAFQYPPYFDNTFFDRNLTGLRYRRLYIESAPLRLHVRPLPRQGRPPLFNGAVGDFTLSVTADPRSVRVGDPVTLTITLTARSGYPEAADLPPLRYQPRLADRFEIPTHRALPVIRGKAKIFTQTVRPRTTDVTEIPPLRFAFFSPASNCYLVAESKPVPLEVKPAPPPVVYGSGAPSGRITPRPLSDGIRQNFPPEALYRCRRFRLGIDAPAGLLLFLLLPPLLVFGSLLAAFAGRRRHSILRFLRSAWAYHRFRRRLRRILREKADDPCAFYAALDRLLRDYLADRLHLRAGAVTCAELRTLLREGVDPDLLDRFCRLFLHCETCRFGRSAAAGSLSPDAPPPRRAAAEASRLLRRIERSLRP